MFKFDDLADKVCAESPFSPKKGSATILLPIIKISFLLAVITN